MKKKAVATNSIGKSKMELSDVRFDEIHPQGMPAPMYAIRIGELNGDG